MFFQTLYSSLNCIVDLVLFSEMLGYLKKVAKLESCKGDTSIHPSNPPDKGVEEFLPNTRTYASPATTPTTICPTIASALWRPLWPPGWHLLSDYLKLFIYYYLYRNERMYRLASKRIINKKLSLER